MDHQTFVDTFCKAWAGEVDIGTLWHADGILQHPTLSEPVEGRLLPALNAANHAALPDLSWRLLDWSGSGDRVYIEWECCATVNGRKVVWRGVDKFVLRDGLIAEETVYSDNLVLWSALDPTMARPALVDVQTLRQAT